jgi:hypothetical protein
MFLYSITTQNTTIHIFTAMKTTNVIKVEKLFLLCEGGGESCCCLPNVQTLWVCQYLIANNSEWWGLSHKILAPMKVISGSPENLFQCPERHQWVIGLYCLFRVSVFMEWNNVCLTPQLGQETCMWKPQECHMVCTVRFLIFFTIVRWVSLVGHGINFKFVNNHLGANVLIVMVTVCPCIIKI